MSRITHIAVYTHRNDLRGKFWNPAIHWTEKFAVFVELTDENGRVGVGECWCFDTATDALCAFLKTEVLPAFLGRDLEDLDEISSALLARATLTARHGILASALSGVDIAVQDLRAQRLGQPIWQMLTTDGARQVRLYASGGLYGRDKGLPELSAEFVAMAGAGFSMAKMKVGGLDLAEDLARVRCALEAMPSDTRLVIDAVYSLTPDTALRLFEALPAERIEAFQSPVAAHDIAGMAKLVRAGVPVMATEAEYRREVHAQLASEGAVTFLQTAPVACGGFGRLQELADLVAGSDVSLSLEVSSTAIALMAACQFAASSAAVAHVEYHHLHQVFFDHLPWSADTNAAERQPPKVPGLGMSLPKQEVDLQFQLNEARIERAAQ